MITIKTIHRISEQGRTSPFFCTASDGNQYFVKGLQANRQSQVNEWICAHLARAFCLPIPHFALLYMDATQYDVLPADYKSIGIGYAFGSQERLGQSWIEHHELSRLPNQLKRDILVFDRWINNLDRTLGNINLIINSNTFDTFVIDHNLAFDVAFDMNEFLKIHVFASEWGNICGDWIERDEYTQRMKTALSTLDEAIHTIPDEWQWLNNEQDTKATLLTNQSARDILNHYEKHEFWTHS